MKRIPFNIMYRPQIESGEYKVVTREDCPVEIKIWDLKGEFPVVGVYHDEKNSRDTAVQVTAEGKCSKTPGEEYCDDFFVIPVNTELTEFEKTIQALFEEAEDRINPIDNDFIKEVSGVILSKARMIFEKEIEKAFESGKAEALKDMPKWEILPRTGKYKPTTVGYSNIGNLRLYHGDYSITIAELEKLPKEESV